MKASAAQSFWKVVNSLLVPDNDMSDDLPSGPAVSLVSVEDCLIVPDEERSDGERLRFSAIEAWLEGRGWHLADPVYPRSEFGFRAN